MTRIFRLWGFAGGLFALGCGASPSEGGTVTDAGEVEVFAEADAPAIVSLELGDWHRVSFHEVGDLLVIAETARNGVPSALDEPRLAAMSPVEMYEALRPGQSAPPELVGAIERLREARSRSPERVDETILEPTFGGGASTLLASPAPLGVGQLVEPLSESYFRNTLQGCAVPPDPVFQVCAPNWGNGFYAYAKSKIARWVFASQSGSFRVKVNASTGGHGSGLFTVNDNSYTRLEARGESCCWICNCDIHPRTLRIDVIDAAGDTFHVGGYWAGR